VGKPEGKRPIGRPRRRWVDNFKMDLLEIGWGGVDWIGLAQDRDKWRALCREVKWQGCEADHSFITSVEVKKTWIYTSTPRTTS
jgi:hypothetical protein